MIFLPIIVLVVNLGFDKSLKYIFAIIFLNLLSSYEKFYNAILVGFKKANYISFICKCIRAIFIFHNFSSK